MEWSTSMQSVVFALGLVVLLRWSRKPLKQKNSHGFYRFFAWVLIWALVVLHLPGWRLLPFSWFKGVSAVLLFASIVFVVLGLYALSRYGQLSQSRADEELYAFERTTSLVSSGVFSWVRHPMYASLIFLAWGAFFQQPQWLYSVLAVGATYLMWRTAIVDEQECQAYFGTPYSEYMQRSKMFGRG